MYKTDQDIFMSIPDCINDMYVAVHNEIEDVKEEIEEEILPIIQEEIQPQLDELTESKFDEVSYSTEDYMLRFSANGEEVAAVEIKSGGGGGGGGSVMTYQNTTGWTQKKVPEVEDTLNLSCFWSSTQEEVPTGPGTLQITVNGITKVSKSVQQGSVTQNIMPYLSEGLNTVKFRVTDVYDNYKQTVFRIEVVALSIVSTYDESEVHNGAFNYSYIPFGAGLKTVYFLIDGTQVATAQTSANGAQQIQAIPAQTHGGHVITVYFETEIGGEMVSSNVLRQNAICVSGSDVIISSTYEGTTLQQYSTVDIEYYAYNPSSGYTNIQYLYDGTSVGTARVDRTKQQFQYTLKDQGNHTLTIKYDNSIYKTFSFIVTESTVDVYVETVARDLYLSAQGRSNNEAEPARSTWADADTGVSCQLTGFNFITNGWFTHAMDERIGAGETVLRIANGAQLTIPIKLFGPTFKKTEGKTIEFRLSVRDVFNYDDVVVSCWQGQTGYERGLKLTARDIYFASSSVNLNTKEKDEEYYTISFVINKSSDLDKVVYTYIDGVMCGAVNYSQNEDFQQLDPVNITIGGAAKATIDVGRVRIYHQNLTRKQVLNNVIADTGNVDEMVAAYQRNNILNSSGAITINMLPPDLPYLLITGELPATKEQGATYVDIQYHDPVTPAKSFTSSRAKCSIQGTSSQHYPRKNYKIKYSNFVMTESGETVSKYALDSSLMPTNVFTYKKDYASSEKANNTLLAPLYSDTLKNVYMFPKQQQENKLRTGIWGKPIVMFHQVEGQDAEFIGCYNFNLDKSSNENYGYSETDGDQCFEFLNNTDLLGKFKSTGTEGLEDYKGSFEFRFPDYEMEEYSMEKFADLKKLVDWVSSTDTTVEGLTQEQIEARRTEFTTNFGKWFVKDAVIYYYIYTLLFLDVDQRQKNMMLQHYGPISYNAQTQLPTEPKWFFAIYDNDTAMSIDNEGTWIPGESYAYEDTDLLPDETGYVFNGHDSVLWNNLSYCFADDIKQAYKTMRGNGKINYNYIDNLYDTHQSKWPERMWNEDAFYCYINPYITAGTNNLRMLLGNKKLQRKYWLYNRFKYLDSKYVASGATEKTITLRSYAGADAPNCKITLKPHINMYGNINWANAAGQARSSHVRMTHGEEYIINCPQPTMNDQEVYIYSADQLASLGDISRLQIDYCDFSAATRLEEIIMGSSAAGWQNAHAFEGFNIGALPLLKKLNMINCTGFTTQPDLSQCPNIEEIYLDNTKVPGVILPDGAPINTLHLPGTITYLGLKNLNSLTDLTIASTANITQLDIENISPDVFDAQTVLASMPNRSIVSLKGVSLGTPQNPLQMEDAKAMLTSYYNKFRKPGGADHPIIEGDLYVYNYSAADVTAIAAMFPDIDIHGTLSLSVIFENQDEAILKTYYVYPHGSVVYTGSTPTMPPTETITYSFMGWNQNRQATQIDPFYGEDVTTDRLLWAIYSEAARLYKITWNNDGGARLGQDQLEWHETPQYTGATPESQLYEYAEFVGWTPQIQIVTKDQIYTATYRDLSNSFLSFVRAVNRPWTFEDSSFYICNIPATYQSAHGCLGSQGGSPTKLIAKNYNGDASHNNKLLTSSNTNMEHFEFDVPNYKFIDTWSGTITNYSGKTLDFLSVYDISSNFVAGNIDCDTIITYEYDLEHAISGPKKHYHPRVNREYGYGHIYVPSSLELIDIGEATRFWGVDSKTTSNLQEIIIHTSSVASYSNSSITHDIPDNCVVYVPQALVEAYKSPTQTNWARVIAAGVQIQPITQEMTDARTAMLNNYTAYNKITHSNYETQLTRRRAWLQEHNYPSFYWDIPLPSQGTFPEKDARLHRYVTGKTNVSDAQYIFENADKIMMGLQYVEGESEITSINLSGNITTINDDAISGLKHIDVINLISPTSTSKSYSGQFGMTTETVNSVEFRSDSVEDVAFKFSGVFNTVSSDINKYLNINGVRVLEIDFSQRQDLSIPSAMFDGMNTLTSIILPPRIQVIPENTFRNCKALSSFNIGSYITQIRNYAFGGCQSLRSITFPQTLTTISQYAFYDSGLTSITIPSTVTTVGADAFRGCTSLVTAQWSTTTGIAESTFQGCSSLTTVTVQNNISVGEYAFSQCSSLSSFDFDKITLFGRYCFAYAGFASITLNKIEQQQHYSGCFAYCNNLTSVVCHWANLNYGLFCSCKNLADVQLTRIKNFIGGVDGCFENCTSLAQIDLPNTIENIGQHTFKGCTSLRTITCRATTPPTLDATALPGLNIVDNIYVPAASVSAYKAATNWATYADKISAITEEE